jgi:ELWxxDGT repeat protein
MYFKAFSPSFGGAGVQLWVTDGTAAGTRAVAGPGTSRPDLIPYEMEATSNRLFVASASPNGQGQLWASDGQNLTLLRTFQPPPPPPGSTPLPPILPGNNSSTPAWMVADGGGKIYFTAADGGNTLLWTSDGTVAGTKSMLDPAKLPAGYSFNAIAGLTPSGGAVYFSASDPSRGMELWKTDGAGGATLVRDISPGASAAYPYVLDAHDNRVFLAADDGTYGTELWVSDGTTAGTKRLTDMNPGIGGGNPTDVYKVNSAYVVPGYSTSLGLSGPGQLRLWGVSNLDAPGGAATTTAVTTSDTSVNPGEGVTLTATVTAPGGGTPTGTVVFRDEWEIFGTAPLSQGRARFTVNDLRAGPHKFQAVYTGNGTFAASASSLANQAVNQLATTIVLTTANPAVGVGQAVTFTARVTPAPGGTEPLSGSVTFYDGSRPINTVALANGVATIQTQTMSEGAHAITASYSGDDNYAASTSAAVQQAVGTAYSISLTTTSATITRDRQATLTAVVASAAPGQPAPAGTVVFLEGDTVLGSVALDASGRATLSAGLGMGTHILSAVYQGATASTSNTVVVNVQRAVSSTSLTSSAPSVPTGQPVTLTARVTTPGTGLPPLTGTVTFRNGSAVLGSATIIQGVATLSVSNLTAGTHTLTAAYEGSTDFAGSSSTGLTQTVTSTTTRATTSTRLTSSAPSVQVGQAVTLTATITTSAVGLPAMTGNVTFRNGSTVLGSAAINKGVATLSVANLPAGTHTLTAAYEGNTDFAGSSSTGLTQTVTGSSPTLPTTFVNTATRIQPSASSPGVGEEVTLTATVTAPPGSAAPIGVMTFYDAGKAIGTAKLNASGVATLATRSLAAGSHTITASYSGWNYYRASTSGLVRLTVRPGTLTTLATSAATAVSGQAVTLTASVGATSSGSGFPGGTVTFMDGTTTLGTATLQNGVATFQTSKLMTAVHGIRAVYAGNSLFATSSSANVYVNVRKADTSVSLATPTMTSDGQSLNLAAAVGVKSPGSGQPAGTVTFYDGSTVIGTASVSQGKATLKIAKPTSGSHSYKAVFAGDASYIGSTSPVTSYSVGKADAQLVLRNYPSAGTATLRLTVSRPAGTTANPTGSVTFKEGSTILGTVPVASNGLASITLKMTRGSHNVTASYSGDANFLAEDSSLAITV